MIAHQAHSICEPTFTIMIGADLNELPDVRICLILPAQLGSYYYR